MKNNKIIKTIIILQCILVLCSSFTFAFSVGCAIGGIIGGALTIATLGVGELTGDNFAYQWGMDSGESMGDW